MTGFIKRERIYVWMVIFILGINLLNIGYAHKKDLSDKKSISLMTFKDMGITEEKARIFFESKKPSAIFFRYSLFAGFLALLAGVAMDILFLSGKKIAFSDNFQAIFAVPLFCFRRKQGGYTFLYCRKEIMPKKTPERFVPWGAADIIRVAIIVVFSGYALAAAGSFILRLFHLSVDINLHAILGTFFIDIIAVTVILHFALVKYKERLSSLGLTCKDFYKNVLSGVTAYIFAMPVLIIVLILSALFLDLIGYKPPPQPVFDMFFEEKRNNVILFLTMFVSILGPIIEEIFFRGFLYSAVRKRFGVFIGILLSGALFSMLHTNITGFLPIMILGVLMAFLYEKTGSLIAPISVHILHNSIIVSFVFFVKEILK